MAISASTVTTTDTLETFRVEFNNLVADVTSIQQVGASNIVISDGGNIGSASDQDAISIAANGVVTFSQAPSFSTGLSVADVDIDGATDIGAAIVDADLFIIDDGASGTNRKTAASRIKTYIADVTLTTAAQTNITSVGTLTALDVDNININGNTITASTGAVNITPASGSAIVLDGAVNIDAGVVTGITSLTSNAILIADAGTIGSASSTSAITIASTGIVTFVDDILIKDGGTIGSASSTSAITIASSGIVTLVDDLLLKDAATIGNASVADIMTLAATGIVTFKDDIIIKDGGTIGAASATDAITIASTGIVTFVDDILIKDGGTIGVASAATAITIASTGIVTFVDDIIIKDAGTIGSASDTDAISISSGGVVGISATTANTNASDGALTVAGGVGIALDASIGDDLRLISDSAILSFGANSEITVTHVHDVGLTITNTIADTDNRPTILQLKSEEDAIVADDVIASIEMAAGDSDGTDGAVVAAGIHAIAEGTFAADANATKLVFTTGVSESAAASATAKMTLSSAGLLTIADDLMIKDGGTIGVATTNDAITIASTGIVTFKDDIIIKDGGTIGSVTDADSITIASDGKVTFGQQTTHSNGILVADGGTIGSASDTDAISISSGGVVAISATTANTDASDGALTVAGGASVAADFSVGDDLRLISDDAILSFGVNSDVTLTHVHNTGIRLSDSMALLLGTGDDISFSWDGTDGHLAVAGTLNVEGSGETLAKFIDDGAVELYHNNVKKFETTAAGVTLTGELLTTGFSSSDFAAAFVVIEDGGTDGSGTDAGDNIIIEDGGTDGAGANAGDDLLMENVTSWVTSGFTIRDSFGNHLQTVNGVS